MSADLVPLRKATGGTAIKFEGHDYEWPEDNAVAEVPEALAARLLAIAGGGYSRVTDVEKAAVVTEPAPEDEHEVTEPAPAAKAAHTATVRSGAAKRPAAK